MKLFWRARLRASAIHLTTSGAIALLAGVLVFAVWYPNLYREVSSGRELFLLVVSVDVMLGPLITLSIFNRAKPWPILRRDLLVVALIQLLALGYGLWTVCLARPVHMVFEYDRFSVVHAVDVPTELLDQTPAGLAALPLTGPTLLSLREFNDDNEKVDATLAALHGLPLAARPDLWQSYDKAVPRVLKAAQPLNLLKARFPSRAQEFDALLAHTKHTPDAVKFLPLVGRKSFWTVFLDAQSAEVLAVVALDSF